MALAKFRSSPLESFVCKPIDKNQKLRLAAACTAMPHERSRILAQQTRRLEEIGMRSELGPTQRAQSTLPLERQSQTHAHENTIVAVRIISCRTSGATAPAIEPQTTWSIARCRYQKTTTARGFGKLNRSRKKPTPIAGASTQPSRQSHKGSRYPRCSHLAFISSLHFQHIHPGHVNSGSVVRF